LSVREYARVQEFPDSWIFVGKTAEKYLQIGNAVPVRLGQVTATVVSELLDAAANGGLARYRSASEQFRRVYIKSHVRTRRWFKGGEVYSGTEADGLAYAAQ
jgi:DNA (cytosine-5)-methyltransferase 1